MKKSICIFNVFILLILTSCARAPIRTLHTMEPYQTLPESVITAPEVLRSDVIHVVAPGETTWRISKMYEVSVEDIARANDLMDPTSLEKGQRLIIPHAAPLKSVVPLWSSKKWKYIVIHHSATDAGNALDFDYAHINRQWKGLGYHFVIDNGTSGKENGQIEVSPRWLHQEDGAHCNASSMNYRAIGICLVGNFSRDRVSPKQMSALMFLVNKLKEYYKIPNSNVLGHGQVKGAKTECPGLNFPWREFRSQLKP